VNTNRSSVHECAHGWLMINTSLIAIYTSAPLTTVVRQQRRARRPYNLYCVGADVKPCSINQSINRGVWKRGRGSAFKFV